MNVEKQSKHLRISRGFVLSALSGVLLAVSFPRLGWFCAAWFALAPLLWAIYESPTRLKALMCGLTAGVVFFGISIYWMTRVSFFAWIFLVAFETVPVIFFSAFVYEAKHIRYFILRPLWIALSWTLMEWLRTQIPIFGFGWNLLAYSQADLVFLTQFANIVGAYGLGCVLAFVNASLFEIFLLRYRPTEIDQSPRRDHFSKKTALWICADMVLVIALFLLLMFYGMSQIQVPQSPPKSLRVSLIQGNIAQVIKWETEAREKIIEIYLRLSELADFDSSELMIWPEAAFPGYLNRDREGDRVSQVVERIQTPVLIGSPHFENEMTVYNSAYLLNKNGEMKGRYDKLFLVPFGEYVPWKPVFGWLEPLAYTLGVSDFSAGKELTVFHLDNDIPFSVLICFEDVFPDLARRFVSQGATFLAVITNDAWFGRSAAPYQHLQASIFRAIENGVSVVRAANTGVSAFISANGIVLERVRGRDGNDIFSTGRKTFPITVDVKNTLYRKGGYLFPYAAFALLCILHLIFRSRRKV